MKKLKHKIPILFISIQVVDNKYGYSTNDSKPLTFPALGILYISSYLKMHGYTNINFLDFAIKKMSKVEFVQYLCEFKPEIIGINMYAESHSRVINLCELIKDKLPNSKIILGGAHAKFIVKEILTNSKADYVCLGEGEALMLELTEHIIYKSIDLENINGLAWKRGKEVIINKSRERIKYLDSLLYPDRSILKDDYFEYWSASTVLTTRGCNGQCTFCCSKAYWGTRIYFRSPVNIFAEIIYIYHTYFLTKGKNSRFWIEIVDDSFTVRRSHIEEFCHLIIDSGIKIFWHCNTRLDNIDKPLLQLMKKAGCKHIQLGIESASPTILNKIKKKIDIEELPRKLKLMGELDILVVLTFIIGFPNDTLDSINYNIEYAIKLWEEHNNIEFIGIAFLTPFPGTKIFEDSKELGLIWHTDKYDKLSLFNPVISTLNFTLEDLVGFFHKFQVYAQKKQLSNQSIHSKIPKYLS